MHPHTALYIPIEHYTPLYSSIISYEGMVTDLWFLVVITLYLHILRGQS